MIALLLLRTLWSFSTSYYLGKETPLSQECYLFPASLLTGLHSEGECILKSLQELICFASQVPLLNQHVLSTQLPEMGWSIVLHLRGKYLSTLTSLWTVGIY